MTYINLNERLARIDESNPVEFKDREKFIDDFKYKYSSVLNVITSRQIYTATLFSYVQDYDTSEIPTRKSKNEVMYIDKNNCIHFDSDVYFYKDININALIDIIEYYIKNGYSFSLDSDRLFIQAKDISLLNKVLNTLAKIKYKATTLNINRYNNETINNQSFIDFYNQFSKIECDGDNCIININNKTKIKEIECRGGSLTFINKYNKDVKIQINDNQSFYTNTDETFLKTVIPNTKIYDLNIQISPDNFPFKFYLAEGTKITNKYDFDDTILLYNSEEFYNNRYITDDIKIIERIEKVYYEKNKTLFNDGEEFLKDLNKKYGKFIRDKNSQISLIINEMYIFIKKYSGYTSDRMIRILGNDYNILKIGANITNNKLYLDVSNGYNKFLIGMFIDLYDYLSKNDIKLEIFVTFIDLIIDDITDKTKQFLLKIFENLSEHIKNTNLTINDVSVLNEYDVFYNIISKTRDLKITSNKGTLKIKLDKELLYNKSIFFEGSFDADVDFGEISQMAILPNIKGLFGNYKISNTKIDYLTITDLDKYSNKTVPTVILDNTEIGRISTVGYREENDDIDKFINSFKNSFR